MPVLSVDKTYTLPGTPPPAYPLFSSYRLLELSLADASMSPPLVVIDNQHISLKCSRPALTLLVVPLARFVTIFVCVALSRCGRPVHGPGRVSFARSPIANHHPLVQGRGLVGWELNDARCAGASDSQGPLWRSSHTLSLSRAWPQMCLMVACAVLVSRVGISTRKLGPGPLRPGALR